MTEPIFPYRRKLITAEQIVAAIDHVIVTYHQVLVDKDLGADTKEVIRLTAIEQIKALGFTAADAERWLKPGNKRVRR